MDAIFTKLIEQLNSSVIVLMLILFVVVWLIYHVGRYREIFGTHIKKLENIDGLGDRMVKLETTVNLIYMNTNPRKLVEAHSPLSLSEEGKKAAETIHADKILGRIHKKLEALVEKEKPKNAYDIQVASMKSTSQMLDLLNEKELSTIKDYAFQQGLRLEELFPIFGVMLRNIILEERGIPIAEVDKHEPKAADLMPSGN
jgi:hypothetical protein